MKGKKKVGSQIIFFFFKSCWLVRKDCVLRTPVARGFFLRTMYTWEMDELLSTVPHCTVNLYPNKPLPMELRLTVDRSATQSPKLATLPPVCSAYESFLIIMNRDHNRSLDSLSKILFFSYSSPYYF